MTNHTTVCGLIVRERHNQWHPARAGGMTQFTGIRGNRMGCRFADNVNAAMTGAACIRRLTVIERQYKIGPSRTGCVAQLTGFGCCRVSCALAGSNSGVMAVAA